MKPEAKVTAAIRRYLKPFERSGEMFVVKIAGGPRQQVGLPDLLLIYRGVAIWLEIKAPGRQPTPLQDVTMRRIRAAGGEAACVWSVDDVALILDKIAVETLA